MARDFRVQQFLTIDDFMNLPITGVPYTISYWFKTYKGEGLQRLLTITDVSRADTYSINQIFNSGGGLWPVFDYALPAFGALNELAPQTSIEVNRWYHYGAIMGDTLRVAFLNGKLHQIQNSNPGSPWSSGAGYRMNRLSLGCLQFSNPDSFFFSGCIAELAFWDTILPTSVITESLSIGITPTQIEPTRLKWYKGFKEDDLNIGLGSRLTNSGTTTAPHFGNIFFRD